jgi:hypothetical protein
MTPLVVKRGTAFSKMVFPLIKKAFSAGMVNSIVGTKPMVAVSNPSSPSPTFINSIYGSAYKAQIDLNIADIDIEKLFEKLCDSLKQDKATVYNVVYKIQMILNCSSEYADKVFDILKDLGLVIMED